MACVLAVIALALPSITYADVNIDTYAPSTPTHRLIGISIEGSSASKVCAVTAAGGVQCWGYSNQPEGFGDGVLTGARSLWRAVPTNVVGVSAAVEVAVGRNWGCALTDSGGVKCWGVNSYFGLDSPTAVTMPWFTSGVVSIAGDYSSLCALLTTGAVQCVGYNAKGQLGNGSTTDSSTPVNVSGLGSGVASITPGHQNFCAITLEGGAKCWGQNHAGQLGTGDKTNQLTPVDVSGLTSGVLEIAINVNNGCAVVTGNTVKCWGSNYYASLGDNTTTDHLTPADVLNVSNATHIAVNNEGASCATLSTGGAKCWGSGAIGSLYDGVFKLPTAVEGLSSTLTQIVGNAAAMCAVTDTGTPLCWGFAAHDMTGTGEDNNYQGIPIAPYDLTNGLPAGVNPQRLIGISSEGSSASKVCAVTAAGGVQCWGYSNQPEGFGDGVLTGARSLWRAVPTNVVGVSAAVEVAVGRNWGCALTNSGGVKCWGVNSYFGLDSPTAVAMPWFTSGVASIAGDNSSLCALLTTGAVKCVGYNYLGQLGNGSTTDSSTPVNVSGLGSGVASITSGHQNFCAITLGGGAKCWGQNHVGQLGTGDTTNRLTPVNVSGLTSGVLEIAINVNNGCAVVTGNTVKCWGSNYYASLGDNTTTDHLTPSNVLNVSNATHIAVNNEGASCATLSTGGAKCWGSGAIGSLYDGVFKLPTAVEGLSSTLTQIVGNAAAMCTVTDTGTPLCWGFLAHDMIGTGRDHDYQGIPIAPYKLTNGLPSANTAPLITSNSGNALAVNVAENSTATITNVDASDTEDGAETNLAYSLSGADAALFSIGTDGTLTFKSPADFETPTDVAGNAAGDNVYEVTVTVTDKAGSTDTQAITVTVTDVDEVAPTLTIDTVATDDMISAAEAKADLVISGTSNAEVGQTVTLTLNDKTYTGLVIGGGNTNNGVRWSITIPAADVAALPGGELTITANVSDVAGNAATPASHDITVIANTAPVFTSPAAATFNENATGIVLNVEVTDDTSKESDATITYSLSGTDDDASFSINPTSGEVTFKQVPDYESPADKNADNAYTLTVQACDANNACDTQTVIVNVLNVEDKVLEYTIRRSVDGRYHVYMRPTMTPITNMSLTGQITLTVPTGTGTNRFTVSDLQSAVPDITWTQSSRADAPSENTALDYLSFTFTPNGTTLFNWQAGVELEVFNFINPNQCDGVVDVMENTDPFTVKPNSVSSNPRNQFTNLGWGTANSNNYLGNYGSAVSCANMLPVITSDAGGDTATISIAENTTAVTTVTATDADNDTLSYSITGGADATKFAIDASTGVLTFIAAPDHEMPTDTGTDNVYDVQVTVSDDLGGTDVQDIAVTVTDEADQVLEYTIRRDVEGRYHVYMRPTMTPITNMSLTGQITLTVPTGTGTNRFTVSDLQSAVPDITWTQSSRADAPSENTALDYLSFTFKPNGTTLFNWQAGVELEVFNFINLNQCVGVVDVIENTDPFTLIPNSVSSNPRNQFTNLGWGTANSNNYLGNYGSAVSCANTLPVITSDAGGDTATISIAENTAAVTTVTATDADNDTLSYSITGGADATKFAIDASTGVLTFVTAPNYETPTDVDTNNTYAVQVTVSDSKNGKDLQDITVTVTDVNEDLALHVRGLLQGGFNTADNLMRDDLRVLGLVPTVQPYSNVSTSLGYTGTETLAPSLLTATGNDAPVDWVVVELRDKTTPKTVVARVAALLQCDGDVADPQTNQTKLLIPKVAAGQYFVSLRHRNHLGVMTQNAVTLSSTPTMVDFTLPTQMVSGTNARLTNGNVALMWAGDANNSDSVIATGPGNDANVVVGTILMHPTNVLANSNFRLNGYYTTDLNLDGVSIYAGPDNDINLLLGNVLLHPANTAIAANYIIRGSMPK